MAGDKTYYCEKCNKTMAAEQFYTSNNLEKYPDDGKLKQCKKCITLHVDNWNPDTYLWILQEVDVPYVPDEWTTLLARYGQNKAKVTGMTILGRYLSKMKLKQYKDFRWKDNDFLQELANSKIEQTMKRQGYDAAEIAEAINKATFSLPEGDLTPPPPPITDTVDELSAYPNNVLSQQVEDELVSDLTEEDRIYLCMKWGKTYRPDEWVRLEQLYTEMTNSYDIQSAGDLNTLKLACKSSLKANQLLDIGDIDGAQKATKMYDSLMKSGKWTAAQNKTEENELIDSVGELVALCERDGFIPKFYVDAPKDKADRVIQDMQKYTHDLIENESGLSIMIERAIKQMDEEEEKIKAAAEAGDESDEDAMFNYDNTTFELEDYSEFNDFQSEQTTEDEEYMLSLLKGEDE